jgi:hypothetical protein
MTSIAGASPSRAWGRKTWFGAVPVIALLLGATLLAALEAPSKPLLDKNSFYLTSSGFKVQVANDAAGRQALHALPPHRFVIHRTANDVRYLYAEPIHCVCIFIGTQEAYANYRDILARPVYGDPYDWNSLNQPTSIADYLQTYY